MTQSEINWAIYSNDDDIPFADLWPEGFLPIGEGNIVKVSSDGITLSYEKRRAMDNVILRSTGIPIRVVSDEEFRETRRKAFDKMANTLNPSTLVGQIARRGREARKRDMKTEEKLDRFDRWFRGFEAAVSGQTHEQGEGLTEFQWGALAGEISTLLANPVYPEVDIPVEDDILCVDKSGGYIRPSPDRMVPRPPKDDDPEF